MNRTAAAGKAVDLYGSGKHGYEDKNLPGSAGTTLVAADRNAPQEEICRSLEAFNVTLAAADLGQLAAVLVGIATGVFGDGSDGDKTTAGDVTLAKDTYYDDLTISAGDTVKTAGFRLFVKGTLTMTATSKLTNEGVDGGDGPAAPAGGVSPGPGSVRDGGDGGAGGPAGFNGSNGTGVSDSLGGAGGVGGNSTQTGGTAGAATLISANEGSMRSLPGAVTGQGSGYNGGTNPTHIRGGGGGGGGANEGGAGGGAGGVLICAAHQAVLASGAIISADGGDGGDGAGTNGAGGGGGGGGVVSFITGTLADSGALITAAGGAAGAKVGTGSVGTAGSAGTVIQL